MHPLTLVLAILRILGAATLGGVALFLSLMAMRPYEPPSVILRLTYPEYLVGYCVAGLVFAIALWRLFRGSSLRAEARKMTEATLGGDNLG